MTRVRIILVADDTFARGGIRAILGGDPAFTVAAETPSLIEARRLGERLQPSLFVVDAPSPGPTTLDLIRLLGSVCQTGLTPVLLIGTGDTTQLDLDALRLGNCAVIRRGTTAAELTAAVRLVAAGYLPVERSLAERLAYTMTRIDVGASKTAIEHRLTPREREVFQLIVQGLSNAEIAANLTVASSTVKSHVQDILGKLGLRNRVEAVIYAYQSMGAGALDRTTA